MFKHLKIKADYHILTFTGKLHLLHKPTVEGVYILKMFCTTDIKSYDCNKYLFLAYIITTKIICATFDTDQPIT